MVHNIFALEIGKMEGLGRMWQKFVRDMCHLLFRVRAIQWAC